MRHRIAFLHTSPAAIQPLMSFFSENAPEIEATNLLDDGILRFLRSGDEVKVEDRLMDMLKTASGDYGAELVVLTCSAISRQMLLRLRKRSPKRIVKIDDSMVRRAVTKGSRIGVALAFPPTLEPTQRSLSDAAAEAGRTIEVVVEAMPDAYAAILAGDVETHDRLLLEGILRLEKSGVDAIVLAQVSMGRIQPRAQSMTSVPVLSSLDTCLEEIRNRVEISQ